MNGTRCLVADCTGTLKVGLDGGVGCRGCMRAFGPESLFREIDGLREQVTKLRKQLQSGDAYVRDSMELIDDIDEDDLANANGWRETTAALLKETAT